MMIAGPIKRSRQAAPPSGSVENDFAGVLGRDALNSQIDCHVENCALYPHGRGGTGGTFPIDGGSTFK